MLAQGPACALARFSFVKSTRAKAQNNIKRSGPFLCRDLAHFYSAIDTQDSANGIVICYEMKKGPVRPTL